MGFLNLETKTNTQSERNELFPIFYSGIKRRKAAKQIRLQGVIFRVYRTKDEL